MKSFYFFLNNGKVDETLAREMPKLNEVSKEGAIHVWKLDNLKFTTDGLHPDECNVYYLKGCEYELCGVVPIDWRLSDYTIPLIDKLIRWRMDVFIVEDLFENCANFPSKSRY